MADWIWVKNEAVNDIPGRIPADVLPAWEARGWVECPAPSDDVEVDAPWNTADDAEHVDMVLAPEEPEEQPDAEVSEQKPSPRGQDKGV